MFKVKLVLIFSLVLFLGVFGVVSNAVASYANVEVVFKWENLVINDVGWNDKITWGNLWAIDSNSSKLEQLGEHNWSMTYNLTPTVTYAKAVYYADPYLIKGIAISGPGGNDTPKSYVEGGRYGKFTIEKTGWISFSIPFTVNYTISASNSPDSYSKVNWWVYAYLWTNKSLKHQSDGFTITAINGETILDSYQGLLNGYIYGRAGESGEFLIKMFSYAETQTPAPLPASFFLLGSGLIGLTGFVLRKK